MKYYLDTIGCRLNQSEIEAYARQLRAAGHTLVPDPAQADWAIINTCAVTAAAVADSRQKIRQVANAGVNDIAITGCWVTLEPSVAAEMPRVTRVIDNQVKDTLVFDLLGQDGELFDLEPVAREPVPGIRLRTRAFIKVQDGCDQRCTFCITTIARGQARSCPIEDVLLDVNAAILGGAQEVVLTGVHLGSWGRDLSQSSHLRDLVTEILKRTDIPRIRLSSLEPWDLDEDFFSMWEDSRMCRHLHLPLQSGCSVTLKRMARKTSPDAFQKLVHAARRTIPGVAITTDIIVGFPGENDREFAESLRFVRHLEFAGGHVFTYSAREGTAAARMADQVPYPIRKERNAQMRQTLAESRRAFQLRTIGWTLPVLWESAAALGPEGWVLKGMADNSLRITASTPVRIWNQITPVQVVRLAGEALQGIVTAH